MAGARERHRGRVTQAPWRRARAPTAPRALSRAMGRLPIGARAAAPRRAIRPFPTRMRPSVRRVTAVSPVAAVARPAAPAAPAARPVARAAEGPAARAAEGPVARAAAGRVARAAEGPVARAAAGRVARAALRRTLARPEMPTIGMWLLALPRRIRPSRRVLAGRGRSSTTCVVPSTASDDNTSDSCGKCSGTTDCVPVSSKACVSGQWPEVHSVSDNEPWHYSRSTHFGETTGGACQFGYYGVCSSSDAFNKTMAGCESFCRAYPDLCAEPDGGVLLRGNFAAPSGNYYTQFWSSLPGNDDNYLSCGECFELVRTQNDGTDYQPTDPGYTPPILLQVVDSCPCAPNAKWCCGSGRDHCGEIMVAPDGGAGFKYGCPLPPGPPPPPADHRSSPEREHPSRSLRRGHVTPPDRHHRREHDRGCHPDSIRTRSVSGSREHLPPDDAECGGLLLRALGRERQGARVRHPRRGAAPVGRLGVDGAGPELQPFETSGALGRLGHSPRGWPVRAAGYDPDHQTPQERRLSQRAPSRAGRSRTTRRLPTGTTSTPAFSSRSCLLARPHPGDHDNDRFPPPCRAGEGKRRIV